jgi:hypothetical protein
MVATIILIKFDEAVLVATTFLNIHPPHHSHLTSNKPKKMRQLYTPDTMQH